MHRRRRKPASTSVRPAIPFSECPAKTWVCPNGSTSLGRSVFNHCQIVGEVARELLSYYPSAIQESVFPTGVELAAACHDIGKVSPTFVAKIYAACGLDYQAMPALAKVDPQEEKKWGGHAGVSQATAETLNTPPYVAEILGQHHGANPMLGTRHGNGDVFGGTAWFDERTKLVQALQKYFATEWPRFENAAQARVAAGLTSVADWIGSGRFFEDPNTAWRPNIQAALKDAGFIRAKIKPNLSFADIFDPASRKMTPRPAQVKFIEQVTGPGVYVLEAQMGMGKTEAALYAAYKLLEKDAATGIYFALPTQLTSNKIYERFNAFLTEIIHPDTPKRAMLLHASAWLTDTEMGEEGKPGGEWFNHKKRGLLAPFAVGTIDQALMAVMNVRHGFVRAFGLVGKVVILDEVHSYDLYTGTLLNELVAFLQHVGCTVIILSATLNQSRRSALLGRTAAAAGYPLISALPMRSDNSKTAALAEVVVPSPSATKVNLHSCEASHFALEEALARAESGQQVLWIENTVADAQQSYLDIASRAVQIGCDVGLLHSRFTPQQREINETRWVSLFGRQGWSQRGSRGRILVGTQVLEQSLDIDADFLVSRFAPTDMLLQRLGRLWRHSNTPRPASARCECWLIMPTLESALQNPPAAFGTSAYVYFPYVLCRSLEVWQTRTQISLPHDIRHVIDQTYQTRQEGGPWQHLHHEMQQGNRWRTGEEAQQALAQLTLASGGKTQPESKAETRYSDSETVDLLLLRNIRTQDGITHLRLLDGRELILPHRRHRLTRTEWRQLSVALNQQIVRVNPAHSPAKILRHELTKCYLHHVLYIGHPDDNEAHLRVARVSESGDILTLDGRAGNENERLEYREDLGFRALSNKE